MKYRYALAVDLTTAKIPQEKVESISRILRRSHRACVEKGWAPDLEPLILAGPVVPHPDWVPIWRHIYYWEVDDGVEMPEDHDDTIDWGGLDTP